MISRRTMFRALGALALLLAAAACSKGGGGSGEGVPVAAAIAVEVSHLPDARCGERTAGGDCADPAHWMVTVASRPVPARVEGSADPLSAAVAEAFRAPDSAKPSRVRLRVDDDAPFGIVARLVDAARAAALQFLDAESPRRGETAAIAAVTLNLTPAGPTPFTLPGREHASHELWILIDFNRPVVGRVMLGRPIPPSNLGDLFIGSQIEAFAKGLAEASSPPVFCIDAAATVPWRAVASAARIARENGIPDVRFEEGKLSR